MIKSNFISLGLVLTFSFADPEYKILADETLLAKSAYEENLNKVQQKIYILKRQHLNTSIFVDIQVIESSVLAIINRYEIGINKIESFIKFGLLKPSTLFSLNLVTLIEQKNKFINIYSKKLKNYLEN